MSTDLECRVVWHSAGVSLQRDGLTVLTFADEQAAGAVGAVLVSIAQAARELEAAKRAADPDRTDPDKEQ
ncbi:hypothetical protein AADG42_05610 [Ammonicoccus fulvus]|uniref:Uncharacterized protein n=1 Tax=Ammonicoccus fulvus TaxID=3138240 RepID=A0ABZ3FL78_9ACTN